jgi:hypothetical protein
MARPKVTETPEFQAAVAKAVEETMAKFTAKLGAARAEAGTSDVPGDKDQDFVRQLAMAIAEISDQGTHRKRVAPEILARRAEAREKMGALIMEARANGEKPEYRLINETYLNERFLKPFIVDQSTKRPVPQEIVWTGVPNERMRPLNDVAKGIFAAFMESIGGQTDLTPNADRRPLWVTAGGLVVKGSPPAKRFAVSGLGDPLPDHTGEAAGFSDDLSVKTANDPTAEFVHVLGTVAAPARQNFAGQK